MILRQAITDDIPCIMEMVRRVVPLMRASGNLQWDDQYPDAATFHRDIECAQLWVAEIDGSVAGVAALTTDQEFEYADAGWDITVSAIVVHRVAVDPGFQGRGLAVALLKHAETLARNRGIGQIRLDTNTENRVFQRLLPKMGYTPVGEIGLALRPGLRFLCYEKVLS